MMNPGSKGRMRNMNDEKEIIERIKRGDEIAFNEMVRLHQKQVYMLALRMVNDSQEALDISQKVFIRVHKAIKGFRGESSLSTWLYRITYNLCIKYLSSKRLKRFIPFDMSTITEPAKNDSSDSVLRDDFQRSLKEAVDKLPAKQKAVFTFRQLQGLSLKETAEIMELQLGTIKAMHFQAIRKLRESLKEWRNVEF
jgi:RNA polymerase sigma-70 factor (ECF subfamily)